MVPGTVQLLHQKHNFAKYNNRAIVVCVCVLCVFCVCLCVFGAGGNMCARLCVCVFIGSVCCVHVCVLCVNVHV